MSNTKKKTGRPTKYKSSYCQKLIRFFDIEPFKKEEIPHYHTNGKIHWKDFRLVPNTLPSLRKFAKAIGVSYQTVYDWTKKHKEFLDAFTHAQEIRKEFLIDNALAGLYPPATFKFVAINMTDMKDVQEQQHSGELIINIKETKTYGSN